MREIQRRSKVGAYHYGGERELAHGPAIPSIQAHTARTNKQPWASAYACAQTFTIVAKDDNQKEN